MFTQLFCRRIHIQSIQTGNSSTGLTNDCKWCRNSCNQSCSWHFKRYRNIYFKKTAGEVWQVNENYIKEHQEQEIEIEIVSSEEIEVNEVEMDEMWSFVHDKSQQYWLWWAIDHNTGEPLAYCFGTREHKYLRELLKLLKPFRINVVYADNNYAYKSQITESTVVTGKKNTQRIERKHLSLRTWCSRLARKSICFSKSHFMHRAVIGLVINYWFFGRDLANFIL